MLPLRYPWAWTAFGWLLVAAVVAGSLLPGHRLPAVFLQDKLVHAGSYFLLMIWFAGLYERRRHVYIALFLLALGLSLDLVQSRMSTRSFEMLDIAANGVGILAGFVLARVLLAGWCQRVERLLFA